MYVVTSVGTGLQYPAPNIRFSTDIAEGGASLSGDPFPSHDPLPLRAKLEDKSLNVSTCSVINVCSWIHVRAALREHYLYCMSVWKQGLHININPHVWLDCKCRSWECLTLMKLLFSEIHFTWQLINTHTLDLTALLSGGFRERSSTLKAQFERTDPQQWKYITSCQ